MQTSTPLRRVSTHTSTTSTTTSSRITPSIHTRRSTDSRVLLEDVLADGDEIWPNRFIHDQPISVVNARSTHLNPLRVIRKLGTGSYAVVYLVQEILDADNPQDSFLDIGQDSISPRRLGRYFAIKCLAKHALDQEAQLLEATIHQSLPVHPNVVTLWTTLETASYLLLVLDYVPGEDLFYFLEQARDHVESTSTEEAAADVTTPPIASLHPNQLLSHPRLKLVASMFTQMCDAVAHCHRNGVFHRDLKPENFMVTDGWAINPATGERERKVSVKLTDFGLATRDVESGDMDCGSAPYMSYECHNNITPTYATAPADVWSLGIVLINMLYHANPWLSTAAGHCQSFEYYLREPIPFFMERFPGMTPAVAEFFARRVFCLLPVPDQQPPISFTNVGRRITADEFGRWARDLALHLGPAARRTPALAFARPPSPSPPTLSRPQTPTNNNNNRLATSISQPGTRTPSPSFHARPPIPSPQPSSVETQMLDGGIILDIGSDEEEEPRSRNGTGSGSKRRKRAPRGKSQSTSQPFSPLTTNSNGAGEELTDAALYAATVLAEKMQNVAREASAIKTGKTPPASAPVPLPTTASLAPASSSSGTVTASSSLSSKPTITLSTKRSTPELRHKKSAKWVNVFRRDSGSDQDVATVDDEDEVANAFNSPSPVAVTAPNSIGNAQKQQQPTAMVKNVTSVFQSLDSTSPPPSVHSRNGSELGSHRGRRKTRGDRGNGNGGNTMDSSSQRDISPGSLMSVSTTSTGKSWGRNRSVPAAPSNSVTSVEPRARSKSPTHSLSDAFNIMARKATANAPPVPVVPEPFRMPPSFGPTPPLFEMPLPPTIISADSSSSRKSYAPSISSVSTSTTTSSAFTAFSSTKKRWTGGSSNSSRYSASSASVRSVSTNATSVSSGSGSWRVGGKKGTPPPLPLNIKQMDGIPWELDEMPRQMAHRPKEHKFSPAPAPKSSNNNRRRPPSAPTSPTPGSSFGLEPISERPTKKSAMKQPRNANQAAFSQQDSQGLSYGEQASGSAEFFPPPKSFGAGRGGIPAGLIHVNTDAANAYLSAGLAGNGMAIHSTDGITTTTTTSALPAPPVVPPTGGPTVVRQPKTPISRLFNWRSKSSSRPE